MTEPYYDILFYDTKSGAKTDTLHRVLRRVFKDTGINIATVDKDSFQSYKNRHVLGYVFPGAKAGSLYREQLPENGNFDFYREEIHKGKTSLNICAMGYNACKSFLYTNPETKSEHRINSEIGMLDFHAFGPDTRLYKPIQLHPENAWTTYSAVEINFKGRNGTKQAGHFALSQGPSFKPAIEATDYEVIAHYSATKDIAILKQDIGKGTIIASGPALEV
ncbi:MAG: Biotin-protein ligase, terminal, partial [Alphaproteobacteria bacterium]|nr:Biotin-protein ligase, terminal [Alphaproteobacteria bacterium]